MSILGAHPTHAPVQEMNSRQFDPVTGYRRKPRGRVPWDVHCRAWECYAKHHGGRGQDAETIAQRGGFGYRELQVFLAGLTRFPADSVELPDVEGWEPTR